MRLRQWIKALAAGWALGLGVPQAPASAQETDPYALEARVWLDRGAEPVLARGDRVRLYYRVSESAFVAIFHIDTNGTVRMVFPSSPQENHYARGGRDYRVLFPGSSYWYVSDDPGMGYYFIVASPRPFDLRDFGYSHFTGGWDLSRVGRQVYGDPYLAMDDYVASLIPEWEYVNYGLDFTSYHVERHYDYPRFLCYDCHGFQPYYSWNPYAYSCASFRVVIYDDPYYYPATRYRGTRVVYTRPRRNTPHFVFKERVAGEAGTPQIVVRDSPPSARPGVEGTENRRAVPRSLDRPSVPGSGTQDDGVVSRPGVTRTPNTRSGVGATNPTVSRGSGTTARTGAPGSSGAVGRSGTTGRPIIERRPTGSSATNRGATTSRTSPVTRPSARVRKPGSGGGAATGRTVPTVRPGSGGGTTTSRTVPTVRRGGTSGGTSTGSGSGTPTVRRGGTSTRTVPTVRSGGGASRTNPVVRPGSGGTTRTNPVVRPGSGGTTRTNPVVRRGGGSSGRTNPVVRSGGGSTPPRTTVTRPPRTVKPPRTGGGGGGTGG